MIRAQRIVTSDVVLALALLAAAMLKRRGNRCGEQKISPVMLLDLDRVP